MKNTLFILIFLTFSESFCQIRTYADCETAESKAEQFAKKGTYIIQNYGDLSEDYFTDFQAFYEFYIYSKYGILIENNGCFSSESGICFGKKTNDLLNDKYGENFLENIKEKLKQEYIDMTIEQKRSLINLDKVYDSYSLALDSGTKYIGNDIRLKKSIKQKLKEQNVFLEASEIEIIIDINGKVLDVNYYDNEKNIIEYDKKAILDSFDKRNDFVPAYLFDKKIKSSYIISFQK
jgi:hypothetical protein